MKKLRVGLIGLGSMGANHARVLAKLNGVELVAIADSANYTKNEVPNRLILTSVEDVIAKGVDYCVVAIPTAFHEEVSVKLIEAGIHVLIEKPLAHNMDSALRIALAASKADVVAGVGHIERYNAAIRQARIRIENGDLGEIYQIATRRMGPFPSRIADVGVVMDLCTHDIDLTSWLGDSAYDNVTSRARALSGRTHEDLVAVVANLKNGIIVSHLVNWISPQKERNVVVTGEKGTFIIDTLSTDLTFWENGRVAVTQEPLALLKGVSQGDIVTFAFEKPEPLLIEHENFRDCLLEKPSEIVTLNQALRTVETAGAVVKSYESQETVQL
jgi:UDP-N-acetylglucosamine 3-dehydrogenase